MAALCCGCVNYSHQCIIEAHVHSVLANTFYNSVLLISIWAICKQIVWCNDNSLIPFRFYCVLLCLCVSITWVIVFVRVSILFIKQ